MDGKNLFEGDIAPDSVAGSFMAGVLAHSRELTVFTNPLPNSYQRFGCDEAPRYVSWSRQNRSQLVRIPMVKGDNCRMELRSPDPACNPYLAIGLILAAGLDGIEKRMVLPPVNRNLFDAAEAEGLGLETLPATLEEAVQVAEESEFLRKVLPEGLSKRYFSEELKRCAALRNAPDQSRARARLLFQRHLIPASAGERSAENGTRTDRKRRCQLQRVYRRATVRDGLQPPGDHSQRSRGAAQNVGI